MTETNFKEHNVVEFFQENLGLLGYRDKIRSLVTMIHEGVINALDAAEGSEILPSISVSIKSVGEESDHYRVIIEDNGPGIPEESIPEAFEMFVGAEKLPNPQSRGQWGAGIGLSGVAIFSQVTTGEPIKVTTSTSGQDGICYEEIIVNVNKNRGKIIDYEKLEGDWRGTRLEFEVKDVVYQRSRYGLYNYLRLTAIANPHVQIKFEEPDGSLTVFERSTEEIPEKPEPVQPHPDGLRAEDLLALAEETQSRKTGTFLVNELSRFSRNKLRELKEIGDIYLDGSPSKLDRNKAKKIVSAFEKMDFIVPSSKNLLPIGEELIESSLHKILNPDFACAVTRSPKTHGSGSPFIVEAGLAHEEKGEEGLDLIRFANRTPLIFDQGNCALTQTSKDIEWSRYNLDPKEEKFTLLISLVSPEVPYKTPHNQSIVKKPEICKEVKLALAQVARRYSKSHGKGDQDKTGEEPREDTGTEGERGSDTLGTEKSDEEEEKLSDFEIERGRKSEELLNEALDLYADYELAKFEDRHSSARDMLAEAGDKLWNSFYNITEAGVGQKLKDSESLERAHTERLELPKKYHDIAERFRDYFYSGGIRERDYEDLEKNFNILADFLEERLERIIKID